MRKSIQYRIMAGLFILLLIAPSFGILREQRNIELVAEMENRTINPKPTAQFLSGTFFNEFEDWYNDRLLGRKNLIRSWATINGKLFNVLISKEVVQGKDGFLFSPFNLSSEIIDEKQKLATVEKIKVASTNSGARFLLFIAPHSEWMLGELLPEKYKPVDIRSMEEHLGNELKQRGIEYLFVGNTISHIPLKERKTMYFSGDYHWTSQGGFFATKEMLHYLGYNNKIDSKTYIIQEKSKADIYTRKVGWKPVESIAPKPWSKEFTDSIDMKYKIDGESNYVNYDVGHKGICVYHNPVATNRLLILWLGDSFFGRMAEYMLQDISTIVVSSNSGVSAPRKKIDVDAMIAEFKPDIVVYEKMGAFFYGHNYSGVFDDIAVK